MLDIRWTTGFTTVEKVATPIAGVLAIYGLLTYRRIISHLRDRHPDTWRALGPPAVFGSHAASVQYLLGPAYRALGDTQLEHLVRRWRLVQLCFLCTLVVLIYQVLRYGP